MAPLSPDECLAEEAEEQLHELKDRCLVADYTGESREALWSAFRGWLAHPGFVPVPGALCCTVLNELTFCQSVPELVDEAWALIIELAEDWERFSREELKEMIRISTFELIAEPPEEPAALRRLFSMAANPRQRWAVFAAYENVPWRLRPHARKYSEGRVTDDDCDEWLREDYWDDEVLMDRGSQILGEAESSPRPLQSAPGPSQRG